MIFAEDITLDKTDVILKPDYARMARDFWLYQEKWRNQDDVRGDCLVIGGVYTIWQLAGKSIYLKDKYRQYDAPDIVGAHDLVLATEETECQFSVGDWVRPNERFEFDNFKAELPTYFDAYFREAKGGHRVTGLLNRYFIFIDFPPLSDLSLPFACGDFLNTRSEASSKN